MPTLIPKAAENLDPNRAIPIANTKTNVKSLTQRRKALPVLTTRTKAATTIEPPHKDQHSKPRFRENAPHVAGKRVKFHDTEGSPTTTTVHPQTSRKLSHFARLYATSHVAESPAPRAVDQSIQRQFTHSTQRERKQSIAYSNYINHLLSPHGHRTVSELPPGVHSALLLHRQAATELCAAKSLYDSCPMRTMRSVIEREVGRGRLTMRLDRDMDVWMQKELLGVFMSYERRWLRLGLEVVLGKPAEMTMIKHALEKIIAQRILSNPSVLKKFTGGGRVKTLSGKYEATLRQVLQHHAMTKMLTLVTFLDMAKSNNILSEDPCLFEKESTIKSSSQVLASICRICFARDEFILNHLAHLGIAVTHIQNPLEEYEFYVRNLASDLKDGVRLAKLAEMLTKRPVLSAMRLPATCRGHKMHNVGEALSALKRAGVENIDDVIPAHIVDAHQPRILQLLWGTIVHFQIGALEEEVIQAEIDGICRWMEEKRASGCEKTVEGYYGVNAVIMKEEKGSRSFERIKSLLLTWCQTVCSFYNVLVENFTSSFSDGKVLCLLISFYHPTLLSSQDILPTLSDVQARLNQSIVMNDTVVQMALQNEQFNLLLALNRMDALGGIPKLFSSKNFLLPPDEHTIILCVSFLFSRLTETSQEIVAARAIQTWWYWSILQRKRAAASRIFAQWRLRKGEYFCNQRLIFASPIRVIESFYKSHEIKFKELARHRAIRRKQESSATKIQSIARMALASNLFRNKLLQHRASKLIQSYSRMFLAKKVKQLLTMHKSSTLVQTTWRSHRIQFAFQFIRSRVISFQSLWRSFRCRQQYEITINKFIIVQSALRRYLVLVRLSNLVASNFRSRSFFRQYLRWCNKKYHPNHHFDQHWVNAVQSLFRLVESRGMMNSQAVEFYSALHIQSIYLGFVTRRNVKAMVIASTQIQRIWRRYQAQLAFGFDLMDIVSAQSIIRRYLVGRLICRMHDTSTTIQRIWRGYRERQIYSYRLIDITISQSIARRFIAQRHFIRKLEASKIIQLIWRGHQRRKIYWHDLTFILKTQSVARRFICRISYLKRRRSSIRIQSTVRKWLVMCSITKATLSATTVRAFNARRWLGSNQASAITIQSFSRGVLARKTLQRIRTSNAIMQGRLRCIRHQHEALTIQKYFRQWLVRRSHQNTFAIQQLWRCHSDKQKYQHFLMKVVAIQSQVRRYIAGKRADKLKTNSALLSDSENLSRTTVQHHCNEGSEVNSIVRESLHCMKEKAASKVRELTEDSSLVFPLSASSESMPDKHTLVLNDRIGIPSSEKRVPDNNPEHGETKTSQEHSVEAPKKVVSVVGQASMEDVMNCVDEIMSKQPQNTHIEIKSQQLSSGILGLECSLSVVRESENFLDISTVDQASVVQQDERLGVSDFPSSTVIKSPPKGMSGRAVNTHHVNNSIVSAREWSHDDEYQGFTRELEELNVQRNPLIPEGNYSSTTHITNDEDTMIPALPHYLDRPGSKYPVSESVALNGMNTVFSHYSDTRYAHHRAPLVCKMVDNASNDDLCEGLRIQTHNADGKVNSTRTKMELNIHDMVVEAPIHSPALRKDFSTDARSKDCYIQDPEIDSFVHDETFYSIREDANTPSMDVKAKTIQAQNLPFANSKSQSKFINRTIRHPRDRNTQEQNNEQYTLKEANLVYDRTAYQSLREGFQEDHEITSRGVQTRYKVSMISALNCAESKAEEPLYCRVPSLLQPSVHNSVRDVTTRSRSSSLDLERTHMALQLVERSHILSDVKEAVKILNNTTEHSKECRTYFTHVKGQNTLCYLITSCNRSSPHLELIHVILKILTNVAKHRSTALHLAKQEVVEVIIYACQMFRDKSKLLALSSSLLEIILKNGGHNTVRLFSTQDQKMRLHGILSLCKQRASLHGSNYHLTQGIANLESVLHMVDGFI